jgi:hypothetical protein
MYAVAFFAVASLVLGLWSEPTVAQPRATSSTLVKTDSGAVLGVAAGNVVSFKGIPYAAPPVDDLRWRVPPIITFSYQRAFSYSNARGPGGDRRATHAR